MNGLAESYLHLYTFPRRNRQLPFSIRRLLDPFAGARLKRDEFLPGRINSDFILNNRVSVSQCNMEEDERNRMIFAKDENVGSVSTLL